MTQINLLPWRARRREEQRREFFMVLAAFLSLSLMFFLILHLIIGLSVDAQIGRDKYLEKQINMLDKQIIDLKDMKKQKEELLTHMQVIQRLQTDRLLVVHLFDDLVRDLPEGVFLNNLKRVKDGLTLQGKADNATRVSILMRNFEHSNWYTKPVLDEIKDEEGRPETLNVFFTLQLSQKASVEELDKHV